MLGGGTCANQRILTGESGFSTKQARRVSKGHGKEGITPVGEEHSASDNSEGALKLVLEDQEFTPLMIAVTFL